jgi:hypothetical protein
LTRIGNQSAATLAELLTGLEQCSDASIFHHTFQTLGSHHFLTEGFSNDFAQWALADANRDALAEQLAALDIRDYVSIAALRADLCSVVREYCSQHPEFANQTALEPFFFCESVEVTVPFGRTATTLEEFHDGVASQSRRFLLSFYFLTAAIAVAHQRFLALARGRLGTPGARGQRQSHRHLHQYSRQRAHEADEADRDRKEES